MASKNKKKKLLTVDQYERSRMLTVDQYEQKQNERRKEQERQRQLQLKQEEEKKKEEAYHKAFMSTPPGYYMDKSYKENQARRKDFNDWLEQRSSEYKTKSKGTTQTATQTGKTYSQDEKNNLIKEYLSEQQGTNAGRQNYDMGKGHGGWEANKEEIGKLSVQTFKQMKSNQQSKAATGAYDDGTDPWLMSNTGLDLYITENADRAKQLRSEAENLKYKGIDDLIDYYSQGKINKKSEEYARFRKDTIDRIDQAVNWKYAPGASYAQKAAALSPEELYKLVTQRNYADDTAGMAEEQKAKLDNLIASARESLATDNTNEYNKLNQQADIYDKNALEGSNARSYRTTVSERNRWANPNDKTAEYNPEYVKTETIYPDVFEGTHTPYVEAQGSKTDKAYYYMNNLPKEGTAENNPDLLRKEYFATPEMVDMFNKYYAADKANGTKTADAFMEAIEPYLNQSKQEYVDYYWREKAEDPLAGTVTRLLSPALNAASGLVGTIATPLALAGVEEAKDPTSNLYMGTKMVNTVREEQNKDVDDWAAENFGEWWRGKGEFLLGIVDSISDNLFAMGVGNLAPGGVASNAGMITVQMIMSNEATSHTMLEKMEQGYDPSEAALYAIGDGVIEALTERYSLEVLLKPNMKNILGDWKKVAGFLGKNFLAEGSEEVAADLLNWGVDTVLSMINGHENEIQKRKRDLVKTGMDPDEAGRQAVLEQWEQMGKSFLAGGISGFALGGGRAALNSVQNRQAGSKLQASGKVNQLINVGLQSEEGSLSRQNAEALQKKTEAGKKTGTAEIGRLAQSIMLESRENMDTKTEQARTESIVKDLQDQGVSEEEAGRLAETIGKALDKGGIENLSKKERDAIHGSQAAVNTLYKYTFDKQAYRDLQKEVIKRTAPDAKSLVSVSSMFRKPGAITANNSEYTRNYEAADSDGYRSATGTEVQGRMGVIVYGKDSVQHAKLLSISSTKNRKGQLMYNVEIDGKQQLVDASQIRTKNAGTAAIIESASNNPDFFNQGYVNAMLLEMNNAKEDVNPGTFMMDAMRIRYAALEWQEMPETQIPADMAQRLYNTAGKAYEQYRINEQEETKVNKPGQGVVRFKGAEAGTAEFDAALDKSGLSEQEKENVRALAGLMKAAGGQDVTFVDNDDIREMEKTRKGLRIFKGAESELYGEQSISGILVNIEGQNYTKDLKTDEKKATGRHHFGIALGHEFTHFLQTHSVNGWNEVAKYVMDVQRKALGEKGLNEAISEYMINQGLTLEKAIAEFVADSCESIFNNKDVLDHIQQTNKSLYGKIRDFVKDLINRVQKAMKGSNTSMTAAGARMVNGNLRELAKRFNLAYDEALSGYITEDNGNQLTPEEYQQMVAEETDTHRFSRAETFEAAQEKYKGKDLINDETLYYYNFLVSMPNIKVQTEIKSNRYTDNKGNIDRTKLEKIAMDNARFVGRELSKNRGVAVKNNYTGREIIITPDGAMHGTTYLNKSVIIRNARATARIGNLAKIAIPLNVMTDEKQQHNGTYAMAAPMVSMDGKHSSIAVLVVDELTGNVLNTEVYDQVHSVSVREKNEAGLEAGTASPSSQFLNGDTGVTRSNISIKELLDVVNSTHKGLLSRDVLRHFGEVKPDKGYWAENTRYSRAQLDNEYMAAVESGNMEAAQQYVDEAAKRAGYDSPKLYHGTRYFGFTEFDIGRGEGLIFATSDRKVAETYSGETARSRILDKTKVNASNLHGNRLLREAQKYIKQYKDYKLLNQKEKETAIKDAKMDLSFIIKDLQDYLAENRYAFDEEKLNIFNRIVESIENLGKAQSQDDVILAWNVFDMATWDMKFMDESRLQEMLGLGTMKNLNRVKNWLNDLYYDGELFVDKYTPQMRVYDTQLALEVNAKLNQGVYELYGKTDNQLVIDANGDNWNQIMPPEELNLYGRQKTRDIAEAAYAHGFDSVLIQNVKDSGGETPYNWPSNVYIYFNGNQVKSADPIVYDDNGDVIPLSERFNDEKTDIRWSRAMTAEQQAEVDAAEEQGIDLNPVNQTASMYFSRASFERSEYYKNPEEMAKMLARNVLGSESKENIAKAKKWIEDVTSISAMIARKPKILDYVASPGRSSFKSNPEYGGSIDSSTICAKRRLQTGTIDAIQRAMPNYVMTAEDFLRVRRMMKDRGYEVSCGLCFVESSRKNIAKYASQFMNEWNSQHPDNQVNMTQINTVLGLENTRINNEEVYKAYEKFMNKLAQRKPKLFEMRSEYDNDIIKHFRNDDSVEAKNRNGGMRINSFSDFEIVHLIDMMQVIMDMSNVGLAGQAYTKVREFAEALGPTGLKINMSMIAAGVDENGKIIFDEVEGMKWNDVKDLRDKYADNVGTVCVVFTEDQLMAAMADDRIDFIIPFHRSQWSKSNYADIGLPENVKDFTYWQNERYATPVYGTKKDGTQKKLRATNYMPNEYWNPNLSGKENAEAYLKMCAENNKIPKFWKWLQPNGDGSFRLKDDGSTDGYWKLLGDFKMYNHLTGDYAAQMPVRPDFDMDASQRMLREYKGGHEAFPEATDVVQDFVKEKKQGRKGLSAGENGRIKLAANEIENRRLSRWTESGMDVNYWMEHATPSMVQTEDERELISMYRGKRTSISLSLKKQGEYRARIRQLEAVDNPSTDVKSELTALKNKLEIEKKKVYRLEEEILQITRNDGWAGMMYQHNMVFRDYVEGRTQEQVRQTIDDMLKLVEQTQEQVTKDTENLKKLATHQAVQTMKSFMGKTSMGKMASILRKTYNSTMNKAEIEDRLAEMALKQASGKDITSDTEALAQDLLDRMRGIRTDTLESLRGQTFVIGQSLADELRKENSSIRELQSRIKGSGIKIVTGVKSSTGEIDKHSRISEQWSELRESNAALPDVENMAEIDKLHTIVDFIESELRASTGAEQFGIDFDEVAAMVRASVGNITTYLTDDPKARAQINNLMKQIADLSKATEKTAADMQGLYGRLDDVMQAGARAKGIATAMERDVNEAIKYYNTTARVAAEKERTKVRKALIAQLRDETTQKLLKQQEKYRSMIENNQKARELHLDNEALRRKISTVASRMANRLFAETDQKNVPEETKGLVREVLRMLSENDSVYRKVTNWDKDRIEDAMKRLNRLTLQNGEFVPAKDLDFLVIKAPNEADNDYTMRDKVWQDILAIESGLEEYRAAETSTLVNQQAKNDALTKVQEALSEIYSVIRARSEAFINGRRYEIATLAEQMENEMAGSRYKGERTGKIGRAFNTIEKMVGYGNLTPEYFFKNLKNGVMKILHGGFHDAEQRAGLEALRAKAVVEKIAKDTKYNTWDPQEKHKVKLPGGREIDMTTEQIMALYATWRRESSQLRPEETAHLLKGGFVLAQGDMTEGLYGRQKNDQRPIRMDKATLEGLRNYLTEDQLRYVVELVNYMSGELAEIGNETSMQQYGIRKFTERYYYPIKAWGGVLNKSSASGVENKSDARAMRQSFTKNLTANAQNAIEIGDFTPTVMKHIVGMITFNTVGPAVENMNKVLNQQLTYGEAVYDENGEIAEDNRYKRNVRAVFQDAYGVNALKYLERFMDDVNGGMTRQQDKSLQEKLLSVFRKGAVAGSLSVAAQQPLSYIRAAMKINPVYLARALAPTHWGKIHDEMLKYSGVAVIKDMGRFDMNQGQSMIDFITPEEKTGKARKAGRAAVEATTILPEKMDALTWGRMWIACKLETAAKNKGMDQKSDEFLQKVAQRFNEVMRQTQVYDSMMVKSQNMRSTNIAIKAMTSFMAEPSLSLNVLADAVRNFNEKGGKLNMGKAAATFIVSAALQALVKAIMSSGRSPDKKKKFEEQFLTKWHSLFMSEVDPLTLIPGYSDIIELFKKGELADDAWGALGKFKTIAQTGIKWATGKSDDHYRNFEDTVGQLAQLMTNVPLKNLMRDGRAIYNFFNPETYAKREYSSAMTKYGIKDSFYTADNMIGLVNSYLQMAGAGYGTTANDYYERIYGAEKAGNKQDAESMREYVLLKSTAEDPQKSMNEGLRKLVKEDDSLTVEEKYQKQKEYGLIKGGSYILGEYENGNLTRKEAEKLYRKENPKKTDKEVLAAFDKIDYEKRTGKEIDSYSNYMPLYDAISNNRSDEIKAAAKYMMDNGYKAEDIKKQLSDKYRQAYLDAKGSEKTKLMDALTKAYKAIGLTADEALKIINGWKPKKEKK